MAREGNGDRRAGDQYDEAPEVNSKRHRYPLESRCCRSRDEKQVKLRKERTEVVRSQAQRRPSAPISCIARVDPTCAEATGANENIPNLRHQAETPLKERSIEYP